MNSLSWQMILFATDLLSSQMLYKALGSIYPINYTSVFLYNVNYTIINLHNVNSNEDMSSINLKINS